MAFVSCLNWQSKLAANLRLIFQASGELSPRKKCLEKLYPNDNFFFAGFQAKPLAWGKCFQLFRENANVRLAMAHYTLHS